MCLPLDLQFGFRISGFLGVFDLLRFSGFPGFAALIFGLVVFIVLVAIWVYFVV